MNFIKNNIWTLSIVALFCFFGFINEAAAGGTSVVQRATDKARAVFNAVKTIIFVVGGFGLVGIAFQAIFGKVKWTWFAGLAVGLAILAAAGAIVNYATGAKMNDGSSSAKVTDTFTDDSAGGFSR